VGVKVVLSGHVAGPVSAEEVLSVLLSATPELLPLLLPELLPELLPLLLPELLPEPLPEPLLPELLPEPLPRPLLPPELLELLPELLPELDPFPKPPSGPAAVTLHAATATTTPTNDETRTMFMSRSLPARLRTPRVPQCRSGGYSGHGRQGPGLTSGGTRSTLRPSRTARAL
jgi:hypothetical protein